MKYREPLKKILCQTRPYWDRDEMSPIVRRVFAKAMQCRTAQLGAEVYASENQELILYHTCKSRACPSCGYRANVQWLRERWAALPDALYKGITFTMPKQLWPLFRDNTPLTKALSALAAEVIKARVSAKYGFARWRHCYSPHLRREVGIQLPRAHYGHRRRVARVPRHVGCSDLL
jgi:hypothetical protein